MTGLYPHVSGHRTLWHLLRPHEPNLLRYLKEGGYDVRWWGKNDLLAPESFRDSVSEAGHPGGAARGPNPYPPEDPRHDSFLFDPLPGDYRGTSDHRCVQAAVDFLLSADADQPFFLFLPLTFPHCPYSAPAPWAGTVDPGSLPPLRSSEAGGRPSFHRLIRRYRRLDQVEAEVFRQINATYLEMIAFTDHLLGILLEALERTGHDRDTTVIVLSDHGDWAGDYGLVEKWSSALDDCLTRVPLVVRTPGGTSGHVVEEPVEALDLMATVLDLAGITPRHTHFSRSLVPQIHGAPGDPSRAVFAEGGYDRHEPHCFEGHPVRDAHLMKPGHIYYPKLLQQQERPESVCRSVMVRTSTHKLIWREEDVPELYDLTLDPREERNRFGAPELAHVQAALTERLLNWYLHTSDTVPTDENPRGHTVAPSAPEQTPRTPQEP
jgi:choline-sulfatase